MLSRRRFLGLAGGFAAGSAAAGGVAWATLLRDHVDEALGAQTPDDVGAGTPSTTGAAPTTTLDPRIASRVLVVLQLGGGNDGLNTLVPSLGRYRDARPALALPESSLVPLGTTGYGLHPALAPLRASWDAGHMVAFESMGLRKQSRSHFAAMDTWWAGTDGTPSTSGWLGRWLDETEGATPNPLRSIALGTGAPALVGVRSLPTVVLDPAQFALRLPRTTNAAAVTAAFLATAAPLSAKPWLASSQRAIPSTLDAIDVLTKARLSAEESDDTATTGKVTTLLKTAAGIIELGIGTRVILVGVNGFDTHSDQLDRHQALLADVGAGIAAFFDRLAAKGLADQVLLVTTSEFGRRVAENGSGGTDHGLGSVELVVGPALQGARVIGDLELDRLVDGDVPISIDTRSLYAVALDWLGGPTDTVLAGRFDRYGVL